jgi:hypothetical protein
MDTELRRDYQRQIDKLKRQLETEKECREHWEKLAIDRGHEVVDLKNKLRGKS